MRKTKIIVVWLGSLWIASVALAATVPLADLEQPKNPAADGKLSYVQLRDTLMDFADEYMLVIGQAADDLQRQNRDPANRIAIHSLKLFPCSAAFSIAVDPNPHEALLDMIIFAHLQNRIWESTLPKRFGSKATPFLRAEKALLEDINAVAIRTIGASKLEELKKMIDIWHKENAGQRYVSYIRFSDLTTTRSEKRGKPAPFSIGTLLSAFQLVNMDETTRSVERARMVGERALYLAQRMPTILRWQTQMLFYELAATPEIKDVTATHQTLRELPRQLTNAGLLLLVAAFLLALLYRIIAKRI